MYICYECEWFQAKREGLYIWKSTMMAGSSIYCNFQIGGIMYICYECEWFQAKREGLYIHKIILR